MIKLDISKTLIAPEDVTAYEGAVASAQQALENATCEGNGFLGWLHLPSQISHVPTHCVSTATLW